MAMTSIDQQRTRAILDALLGTDGGLSARSLAPVVEIATGRDWPDADRDLLLLALRGKGLLSTYTNRVTDETIYIVTDLGRAALAGGLR